MDPIEKITIELQNQVIVSIKEANISHDQSMNSSMVCDTYAT